MEELEKLYRPLAYEELVKNEYYPNRTASEILKHRKEIVDKYNTDLYNIYEEKINNWIKIKESYTLPYWQKCGHKSFEDYTLKCSGINQSNFLHILHNQENYLNIIRVYSKMNELTEMYLKLYMREH